MSGGPDSDSGNSLSGQSAGYMDIEYVTTDSEKSVADVLADSDQIVTDLVQDVDEAEASNSEWIC